MRKRPDKDLPHDWCLYVILHAEWRASRGKKPSMSYNDIRNPKKALEEAMKDQYPDWDDSWDDCMTDEEYEECYGEPRNQKNNQSHQWTEQDELRCLKSPMLNNFRIFASNLEQADAMVEDFFWVVSGENMEDCNTALMVLSLYRNELAKKVARELLEMI